MVSEESFWYRVGYALERGRTPTAPREWKRLAGLAERASRAHPTNNSPEGFAVEQLLSVGVAALAGRLLDVWRPKRRAGLTRLAWAGASGAAAALLVDALKPLLRGEPESPMFDRETGDRVLAGLGQGLLYGAVIEPRVPGPAVLKGALFGSAEYAADAAGGLVSVLAAHAPQRRLPFVGRMLEDVDPHDRVYLEHLAFGVVLAILYGSSASSNGMADEEEDE
ncbi:MAG: hypothetical protein AB7T31_06100 [Gemmatimonadales bacterium]